MHKTCFGLLVMLLLGGVVSAQEDGHSLDVISDPPGAEVTVEGDARITGITPVTFKFPMVGEYKLTVKKHGYENYSTKLMLAPTIPVHLDIALVPKTGFKAAVRSMFVPGWGQVYTEQKTKAFAFATLFAGAVTAFVIADNRFSDKQDAFELAKNNYDNGLSSGVGPDELKRLWTARNDAQSEAFDAETIRRVSIGAVAGVWGLNVLDALLFTRSEQGGINYKGVDINPTTDGETVSLKLTKAF